MARRVLVAYFVLATGTVGFAQVTHSAPSSRSADTQPRTSILCGTRVFYPDSSIDPKIAKTPPAGSVHASHAAAACMPRHGSPRHWLS